jgi:hypothetical protein
MKKIINHLKDNWVALGFETLAIIIGIWGAFLLNNWNEDRKQRTREVQLLTELQEAHQGTENLFSGNLNHQHKIKKVGKY